jgi:flagellum-specific ATP synthase
VDERIPFEQTIFELAHLFSEEALIERQRSTM